jgi:hypothetical protein
VSRDDLSVIIEALISWKALFGLAMFLLFMLIVRFVALGRAEKPKNSVTFVRKILGAVQGSKSAAGPKVPSAASAKAEAPAEKGKSDRGARKERMGRRLAAQKSEDNMEENGEDEGPSPSSFQD